LLRSILRSILREEEEEEEEEVGVGASFLLLPKYPSGFFSDATRVDN